MRLRRYGPVVFIAALLAVSGFAAAAIASSSGIAGSLQTTATTTAVSTVTSTTTVTTTVTRPARVTICHHARARNGATKHVTITVGASALAAHLRHGDTTGRCGTARNQRVHKGKAHAKKFHKKAKGRRR